MRTRETRNRVKQDDHVAFVFDESFGFLDDHVSHLHVASRWFIERR